MRVKHRPRFHFLDKFSLFFKLDGETMRSKFRDRSEAGELLAKRLVDELPNTDLVVVALPRGGLEVAAPIARLLDAPLNILAVRKLGAPNQPELAIGAIASGGFIFLNQEIVDALGVTPEQIVKIRETQSTELRRREELYLQGRSQRGLTDQRILLVDDGIATGATIEVAIRAIKAAQPKSINIAVPVAALSAIERLHRHVDHIYALQTPSMLGAVGEFYETFSPVSDDEVIRIMQESEAYGRKRVASDYKK